MPDSSELLTVTIAICTFKRPEALLALLRSLENSRLNTGCCRTTTLLLIDNDPEQSAKKTVEAYACTSALPIRYVHEPTRGLVAARNRALDEAISAKFLIFLDDDELVDPRWFDELISTLVATKAQFVIGPVRPIFPAGISSVFSKSGLFNREEFADRQSVEGGNTGNCCIDLEWLRAKEIRFRSPFNRSGGEDAAFFAEMNQAGAKGHYAAHAVVHEPVARERLSVVWLLRRRMRFGATIVIQRMTLQHLGVWGRISCGIEGIARAVAGFCLAASLLLIAPHLALKYSAASARGIGYFLGALGINIREY